MAYWHLDPDHVDCLQPGKRVCHTMNPVMVVRNEDASPSRAHPGGATGESKKGGGRQLILVCGTPGANTQVQTNLQVVTHILDFGMTVAEAVEAPRWRNTQNHTESALAHEADDRLFLEDRFDDQVRSGLTTKGHPLNIIGPWEAAGSEMMIQVNPETGTISGAADTRRDGYAIGW